MPSKSSIFTPLSILFRPHQKPVKKTDRFLVEAPGTAPGSNRFITPAVYCHSRSEDRQPRYRDFGRRWKGACADAVAKTSNSAAQARACNAALPWKTPAAGWTGRAGALLLSCETNRRTGLAALSRSSERCDHAQVTRCPDTPNTSISILSNISSKRATGVLIALRSGHSRPSAR